MAADKINTYQVPVSVKGILIENNKVWLRLNRRNEWELPGGKIDLDEQPTDALKREIKEELGFEIEIGEIISAFLKKIPTSPDEANGVLILVYSCKIIDKPGKFETDSDGGYKAEFKQFSLEEIKSSKDIWPEYKNIIKKILGK